MRQLPTKDQNAQKLPTIGHRTTFNNEQSSYRIFSYNRPRKENVKKKKSNEKTNSLIYVTKMIKKQTCCHDTSYVHIFYDSMILNP